jgi:hypothetical protein
MKVYKIILPSFCFWIRIAGSCMGKKIRNRDKHTDKWAAYTKKAWLTHF